MSDAFKPAESLGRRKLPPGYATVVLPLLLSIIMTAIVSFISTVRSIGLAKHLLAIWLSAWGLSLLIAFPTSLFVLPLARRLTLVFVHSR